jgi:hypothetical protein
MAKAAPKAAPTPKLVTKVVMLVFILLPPILNKVNLV